MRRDTSSLFSVACWSLKWEGISGAGHYRPWRTVPPRRPALVLTPGSSAECPASGTTVSRAPGQAAANSNAVSGGTTGPGSAPARSPPGCWSDAAHLSRVTFLPAGTGHARSNAPRSAPGRMRCGPARGSSPPCRGRAAGSSTNLRTGSPGARRRQMHRRVRMAQPSQVVAQQVAAFGLRHDGSTNSAFRHRGKTRFRPVKEPLHLRPAAEEHAAQHAAQHPLGVLLRIGKREGGPPGAAEQQPSLDAEETAQHLDVGDEVRGGVSRNPRPAGVTDRHRVGRKSRCANRRGRRSAGAPRRPRPPVRHAGTAPAGRAGCPPVPVHDVAGGQRQEAGLERPDIGKRSPRGMVVRML